MGEAIGQILPLAVGVALSVLPIIAVILILFTPKARLNSIFFLIGWILGLTVVGVLVLILGDTTTDDGGGESTTSGVVKLVLGFLLLLLALRNWRSRPAEGEEVEMPKWMNAIDSFNAVKSAGIAFLLSGINPKNLALTAAAALTIVSAGLSTGEQVGVLVVFILIASSTVAAPVLVYLVVGEKADPGLTRLKGWLSANNAVVMAVLFVVFGFKLIGDGISILSG
jgi:hypothetical protein